MFKIFSYQRATRLLFWMVTAILLSFSFLAYNFLHGQMLYVYLGITILLQLYFIVLRLHDVNRGGWNVLWIVVPILGWGILLYYLSRKGQMGSNYYGEMIQ